MRAWRFHPLVCRVRDAWKVLVGRLTVDRQSRVNDAGDKQRRRRAKLIMSPLQILGRLHRVGKCQILVCLDCFKRTSTTDACYRIYRTFHCEHCNGPLAAEDQILR